MRIILEILALALVFYVAVRIGMHAQRRYDRRALLSPPREKCELCGSDTLYNGKLIHYTDCKTGLG